MVTMGKCDGDDDNDDDENDVNTNETNNLNKHDISLKTNDFSGCKAPQRPTRTHALREC